MLSNSVMWPLTFNLNVALCIIKVSFSPGKAGKCHVVFTCNNRNMSLPYAYGTNPESPHRDKTSTFHPKTCVA